MGLKAKLDKQHNERRDIMRDPEARKKAEDEFEAYQASLLKPPVLHDADKPLEFTPVDDKLALDTYIPDDEGPHIVLKDITPEDMAAFHKMQVVCPAGRFNLDADENPHFEPAGCLECGACRIIGEHTIIDKWELPPGGCGVEFHY